MSNDNIEAAIVAAGADKAPRVTPADIEAAIASEHYCTAFHGREGALTLNQYVGRESPAPDWSTSDLNPLRLLTFCTLVLRNGFTVVGTSACASPENFDAEIGRRVARADAVRKVWPLLGYALRERLHRVEQGAPAVEQRLRELHLPPAADDWRSRLIVEREELIGRIRKLDEFVVGEAFQALAAQRRILMLRQLAAMNSYLDALNQRVGLEGGAL